MEICIVGAGIAGLAAAVRLRCQGHRVQVFERNAYPGGKLTTLSIGGYRFDAGPSLFTLPELVEDLFRTAGRSVEGRFAYRRLPVTCNYFWEDGTRLSAFAEHEAFCTETERVLGVPPRVLQKALYQARFKYEAAAPTFLFRSLHRWSTYFSRSVLRLLGKGWGLDLLSSMNSVNERLFAGYPKMVQLFNRYATYNGSDPYQAPGILTMIPHLEHTLGAYLPVGGMKSISQSIYELAVELGVAFHFNQTVEEILVRDRRVVGLRVGGQTVAAQAVVCNMDVFFAYDRLLPGQKAPRRILRQPKSSSALIFYWGIKTQFPALDVHNIFFAEDYRSEFKAIFKDKTLYEDPTVYVHITSKYEAEDAPEGCENWFVMINVPADEGQDWDRLIPQARRRILDKLSRLLDTDIESLIEAEDLLEPRTIESRTLSHQGALYGTSSNTRMAAFLRHPNFSRRIGGLYFCGGSVHPGGGIPLCLSSGKIVSEEIQTLKE